MRGKMEAAPAGGQRHAKKGDLQRHTLRCCVAYYVVARLEMRWPYCTTALPVGSDMGTCHEGAAHLPSATLPAPRGVEPLQPAHCATKQDLRFLQRPLFQAASVCTPISLSVYMMLVQRMMTTPPCCRLGNLSQPASLPLPGLCLMLPCCASASACAQAVPCASASTLSPKGVSLHGGGQGSPLAGGATARAAA